MSDTDKDNENLDWIYQVVSKYTNVSMHKGKSMSLSFTIDQVVHKNTKNTKKLQIYECEFHTRPTVHAQGSFFS